MDNQSVETGNNKSKLFKIVISILFSYISTLGIAYFQDLQNSSSYGGVSTFGFSFISILVWILAGISIYRFIERKDGKLHIISIVAGALISVSTVWGTILLMKNNLFTSAENVLSQVLAILEFSLCTIPFSEEVFVLFGKIENYFGKNRTETETNTKSVLKLNFFAIWGIIFAAYIPLFLAWWPGNFFFDAPYQMINVIDEFYTTHHPLAHTLLMGNCYKLGLKMNNVSLGYSFYTLIQMLFMSGCLAYIVRVTIKRGMPKVVSLVTMLVFALFPMHALFAISSTKDVIFSGAFAVFMTELFCVFHDEEKMTWKSYAILILFGGISVLYRNNAAYAIIAGGILMIPFTKGWKYKIKLLGIIAAVLILGFSCNKILALSVNAQTTDQYRETMSVPIQCLGRVADYRKEELAPELYDEICLYINEEDLPNYNPYCSDLLKNTANEELLKTNTVNFLKLWIKVGLKFPDEYLEAVLTNTLGYWDLGNKAYFTEADVPLSHTLIGKGAEIEKKNLCPPAFSFYSNLFWELNYRKTPGLGFLFRSDLYVWMILFYMLWTGYRKKINGLKCMFIPLMYLGTCLLGPMAALRYVYCLVILLPVFLCNLYSIKKAEDMIEKQQ